MQHTRYLKLKKGHKKVNEAPRRNTTKAKNIKFEEAISDEHC
jgi:hypothetical protein